MKIPRMANAVEHIDDDLINGAAGSTKATKNNIWLRWGAIAACFMLVVSGTLVMLEAYEDHTPPVIKDTNVSTDDLIRFEDLNRNYNGKVMLTETAARIFPSSYLLSSEKYTSVNYKGNEYVSRQRAISPSLLGEGLGKCSANGFIKSFNAYKINGVSEENLIALAMDDEYYVYRRFDSKQPETFGELLDMYSLNVTLPFERFSIYENGYNEKGYYKTSANEYIWQILSECRDATAYADADHWNRGERNYLSFTATSEALGIYKKAFYITEDGYIWTNIFEYAYVYFIGETAANDIIAYVKANSTETEMEPYEYSISGTITEIGDGYILVDDAILCTDPEDGMVFKILTEDLRIRRYLECWNFNVGDVVSVKFQNEILLGKDNTVDGANSIHKGVLTDQGILIPE